MPTNRDRLKKKLKHYVLRMTLIGFAPLVVNLLLQLSLLTWIPAQWFGPRKKIAEFGFPLIDVGLTLHGLAARRRAKTFAADCAALGISPVDGWQV